MHYVISDVHGCYDLFLKLLDDIHFSENDTLYLLGDMIDRGPDGIRLLQDVMQRNNVVPFLGNHEDMLCRVIRSTGKKLSFRKRIDRKSTMLNWTVYNGGGVTWDAWRALSEPEKRTLLAYLETFSVYRELSVGGHAFLLVHAGVGKYAPDIDPARCPLEDLIWARMDYDKTYYPDRFIVSGHTPTGLIDPACSGRFFRRNNHIAIDCGAVFTGRLGCLCLETLEEFYAKR